MIVELRGLPQSVGIPPFTRCVGLSGTLLGTLRGFFLSLSFGLALTALAVRSLRLSCPPCFFLCGGRGYPRVTQGFPRGRRPLGEAVACRLPSFFTSFLHSFFLFLDFLHFRHIRGFACDTPGFSRVFGFFAGFLRFATRRGFGLFSTFLSCFVWTVPV